MKKLALLGCVFTGLLAAACGGGGNDGVVIRTDGGGTDGAPAACNPNAQTGCEATEKCTWIIDNNGATPDLDAGHMGCVAAGSVATGGACTFNGAMTTGFDDCVKGDFCLSGTCRATCSTDGAAPTCAEDFECARYSGVYALPADSATTGICDPSCNVLEDTRADTGAAKCGSANPDMPTLGCYFFWTEAGGSQASCAGVGDPTLTNRVELTTTPFINACAQGNLPLLRSATGVDDVLCIGTCNPAPTSQGMSANSNGVPLNGQPAGGLGTCDFRGNGETTTTDCHYGWEFQRGDDGSLVDDDLSNLGYCFDPSTYTFDNSTELGGTATQVLPRCGDLLLTEPSPHPSGYPGTAVEWGCQDAAAWKEFFLANSTLRGKSMHRTYVQRAGFSVPHGQLLAPVRH